MVPKRHTSVETALYSAKTNGTTAVMVITYGEEMKPKPEILSIDYYTFRNITHSGDLVTDFPIVLEENQRIRILE
jgi:hypothetical protein